MEALGAVAGSVGLVSSAISACKGLLEYYASYKGAGDSVARMCQSIEELSKTFVLLNSVIARTPLNHDASQRVRESIESCEGGISALERKLAKIQCHTEQNNETERSLGRLRKLSYPFKESTLMKLKEICNDLRSNLHLAAAALGIDTSVTSLEKLDNLQENVAGISTDVKNLLNSNSTALQRLDNETLTRIYDWLSPLAGDFERKQQELCLIVDRQDGMARGLFDSAEFKTWRQGTRQSIWCTGMQGIGKSVLTSFVIETLQQEAITSNVGTAYIYCNYKDTKRQSPNNLTASLLQQLLMQTNSATSKEDLVALYERHAKNKTRPILNEYQDVLRNTVNSFSKVYIVVDGLDECPETKSVRSNFLAGIQNLQSQTCTFFTSRYLPSIEVDISGAVRVQLESSDEDIRKYLELRLQKWRLLQGHLRKEPELGEKIVESILGKAQRMFLLARLYIEWLSQLITIREVKTALNTLPEGLDDMYDDILERIKAQDLRLASLAANVLGWIYYAARPLKLLEIQHALAIEPGDTVLDEDGLLGKERILSVCGGLLSIQEGEAVTFSHYTVNEYFKRRPPAFFKDVRAKITQTCLTYLSFEALSHGAAPNDDEFERRLSQHPFLEYASSYWGVHVRDQEISTQGTDDLAIKFLKNLGAVSASAQIKTVCAQEHRTQFPRYSEECSKRTPGLVLAATFGLDLTANTLIQQGADIEEEDSEGARALHRAIWENHTSMAQLLLDHGADCQAPILESWTLYTIRKGYPMHLAAFKGNVDIIEQLIAKKADVNIRLQDRWTPLHLAAVNGHVPVIQLLIKHGAEINATDGSVTTAINRAAEHGQIDVVRLLIQNGADVNIKTWSDQTPLFRAAANGHDATVALLLENGADWTIKDFLGYTALYRAQSQGNDEVIARLKKWTREHQAL